MNVPHAPRRVCRVIARLNIGGPARHVALLDRGLRERGVATLLAFGQVAAGEESLEYLVQEFGNPSRRIPDLGRRISLGSDVRALVHLVRLLFEMRPDIVHTHTAKAGTLGRLAAVLYNATRRRHKRCALVHTFHGHVFAGYFGRTTSALVCAIERLLARLTDRIVVISAQQRVDIVERYRIAPAARVSVVPLGFDLADLKTLAPGAPGMRGGLGLGPDDLVVGFVGRFAPIKDLPTLIDAFRIVAARVPRARLVLAGDGETRGAIEGKIREAGLTSHVILAGWQYDLPALYATFDVLALTSINEGTPVAVIEAMAAGLPVVATTAGGVVDLVESGTTGLLVPVGDAAALAEALVSLLASKDARDRMGTAGRGRVGRFADSRLVDDIEQVYRDALAVRRGAVAAELGG